MAETSGTLTNRSLEQILHRGVEVPLNRGAAAALTLALEIRKADHLSRGEKISDDALTAEIREVYFEMMALTDPTSSHVKALERSAQAKLKP